MSKSVFQKSFTQQEAIPDDVIERVVEVLKGGRLHRYNTAESESSEASLLEQEYAEYQGSRYCLACTSGGYALQVALRSIGIKPGEKVLANAYTLAPVPGAIHAAGGVPVFVEIDDHWHVDIDDLERKADESGARYMMLSHMRGHISDMDAVVSICRKRGIKIVEDCAHTMGALWKGARSGNFGDVACFSTQTYKHLNSGEGGLLTTNDEEIAARAIVHSGSYMLYQRHGTPPSEEVFRRIRLETPNMSGRLDNVRAALIRGQLPLLEDNITRWNQRYRILETGLRKCSRLFVPERAQHEFFVGSSIQFQVTGFESSRIPKLVQRCSARGVVIKWFGGSEPNGFTSRYDSWKYLGEQPVLENTIDVLSKTCDLRIPLTFDEADCAQIADIICTEAEAI